MQKLQYSMNYIEDMITYLYDEISEEIENSFDVTGRDFMINMRRSELGRSRKEGTVKKKYLTAVLFSCKIA